MNKIRFWNLLLVVLPTLILPGCSAYQRIDPQLPKTFLEDVDMKQKIERLPFKHSWAKAGIDRKLYKGIFIKPVRVDTLDLADWVESTSVAITSSDDYMREAGTIANYFHKQLITDFKAKGGKELSTLVDQPGPDVLVLEIALTKLVFAHPITNAAVLAVPVPGAGAISSGISDPHVAFAARVTDGKTNALLATAADQKFSPTRVFDLNKFTISSTPREICAIWSTSIADTFASDALTKVETKSWDWKPW